MPKIERLKKTIDRNDRITHLPKRIGMTDDPFIQHYASQWKKNNEKTNKQKKKHKKTRTSWTLIMAMKHLEERFKSVSASWSYDSYRKRR